VLAAQRIHPTETAGNAFFRMTYLNLGGHLAGVAF
jgi:hypothetical protein